jgi:hypothetical protein
VSLAVLGDQKLVIAISSDLSSSSGHRRLNNRKALSRCRGDVTRPDERSDRWPFEDVVEALSVNARAVR